MSDHAAVYLAAGLIIALIAGVYVEKLAQAYRDIGSAKGRLRAAVRTMRSVRLRFVLITAVMIVAVGAVLHL